MVRAQSRVFQRIILGWLQRSLWRCPSWPLYSIRLYHQPTSSDLYRTSVGLHPLSRCHQNTIILIIANSNQSHTTHSLSVPRFSHVPHPFHTMHASHHTPHMLRSSGVFGHHKETQDLSQHSSENIGVWYFYILSSFYIHSTTFLHSTTIWLFSNSVYAYVWTSIYIWAVICTSAVQIST